MLSPANPKYSGAGKSFRNPGDLYNSFKNGLRTVAAIPNGLRSGKSVVANATKDAQAKVYKNVAPAQRMQGQLIEKGVSPKAAAVTSYGAAQKTLGSYKKGGKVPATGAYKLHKGERVLNTKQTANFEKKDMKMDKKAGVKEGSKKDMSLDKKISSVKKTGSFNGKSNKLGQGGRAAQLKAKGVPGGVIGALARKAQAAPGMKNYH